MKEFVILWVGVIVGLCLSFLLHELSNTCSNSGEIKTAKKIIPTTVITQSEKKSDTLYIYTKAE